MFKIIRYFLFGFLITSFQTLFGQTETAPTPGYTVDYNTVNMPASPSASSFASIAGNLTVNTATGVPNISIPLYTYELDGVEIPIILSYNARGIKVGDMATSVGLNWTLDAGGQISRTVRNKLDEYNGWFSSDYTFLSNDWYSSYDTPTMSITEWQDAMKADYPHHKGYAKDNDHNPDLFSYSIPGYSGEYIHTPSSQIIKSQRDGLTISPLYDGDINFPLNASDLNGNLYYFFTGSAPNEPDHAERSKNKNFYSTNGNPPENIFEWEIDEVTRPITAWKLSKIVTKNNKVINFAYLSKNMVYTLIGTSNHISVGEQCEGTSPVRTLSKTDVQYDYNTQLIKKIWSPQGTITVDFTYEEDTNLPPSTWKTKLTKINISNSITSTVKEFEFYYSRYNGYDPRLKLDSISEINGTVSKPPYKFIYKSASLPYKDALSQDFFGYYNNGPTAPNSLVPFLNNLNLGNHQAYYVANSRDRGVNPNTVDNGILTDIQYPTGGRTHFLYEPNAIGDRYCGGVRIKEIEDWDNSLRYNRKTYDYAGLKGMNLVDDFGNIEGDDGSTKTYNSNFITLPGSARGHKTGYFYSNVTVTHFNGTENFKEIFNYEEDVEALDKYNYALSSQIIKKGGEVVKRIEYENSTVGTFSYLNWNALGGMMCYQPPLNHKLLGYNDFPLLVQFTGNYAYLPTEIATTDYLRLGSILKAVTTRKFITYDPNTLLKTKEIVDTRYSSNGDGTFEQTNNNGEIITTDYKYPWSPEINLPHLPPSLPISKIVMSSNHDGQIFGQYFEYDSNGNIKTTYQYNKGEGITNTSGYGPPNYEQMNSFLFKNGKPIQSLDRYGSPTSYIWAFKDEYPVAKIEGRTRASIDQQKVLAVENATSLSGVSSALTALREDATVANAMITTYTHSPLRGVQTITDPKGDKTTFEYDGFGRLIQVKDQKGKIITENYYHYDGQ